MKFKRYFLTATLAAVARGMSAQETVMVEKSRPYIVPTGTYRDSSASRKLSARPRLAS